LQQVGCQGDPALEQLARLPTSSATLVSMIRFMVRRFLAGSEAERADLDPRLRLVLHSCLEDGAYARELFDAVSAQVMPFFTASFGAAVTAGDLMPPPGAVANHFWFAHHVAAMMAFASLPGRSCVPYEGELDALVEEASHFILRGLGMSDAAIAANRKAFPGEPALQSVAD